MEPVLEDVVPLLDADVPVVVVPLLDDVVPVVVVPLLDVVVPVVVVLFDVVPVEPNEDVLLLVEVPELVEELVVEVVVFWI